MPDSPVMTTRNGPILEVVLNRPKANAIDAATSRELGDVFQEFRDDDSLRVAIFTGGGERFFSAGWDLKAAAEGEDYESDYGPGGFGGFPELPNLNKPVIAAVNGLALGGGFEIAMAADLIIAADTAEFGLPEARVGVIPDAGTVRLQRLLPRAIARDMLFTGRRMGADEALSHGLVNAVVPQADLMDAARAKAAEIVACAPLAIAAIKDLLTLTDGLATDEAFGLMRSGNVASYEKMLKSEDAVEGPAAFAEKRPPVWKGR